MNLNPRIVAIFCAALLLVLFVIPAFYVSLLCLVGLLVIPAIGLIVLTGIVGLTSFGQAAFVGLGAYTTGYLCTRFGFSPWITLPIALAFVGAASFVIGVLTVRLSGHYLILGTIAWSISIFYAFGNTEALGGYNGVTNIPSLSLLGIDLGSGRAMCAIIWIVVMLALIATANLLDSRVGRALRVLRNTELAESMGVEVPRLRLIAFVYAALLAGIGGWLYAHYLHYISPGPFSINASFDYIFMAVTGGVSSIWGAIAGPILVTALKTSLQSVMPTFFGTSSQFELVAFGVVMVLLLQRAPQGLVPYLSGSLPNVRGKLAIAEVEALPRRTASNGKGQLLEVRSLGKSFGGLEAIKDLSFSLSEREILGLIGPNGAGKSTLFNLVSGLLKPTRGEIYFRGKRLPDLRPGQVVRRGIVRTFQHVQLRAGMSVIENVALGCHTRGHSGVIAGALHLERAENSRMLFEARRQLERVGLGDRLYDDATTLPLGQQRVVEIARALCADPTILLLDEPAAGLRHNEKATIAQLLSALKSEGLSIILVEHDMKFVMGVVDRVVVMDFGQKISEGAPAFVQSDQKVREAYLGIET